MLILFILDRRKDGVNVIRIDRIQRLLYERDMNYTDLARSTGMLPQVVNRYCNGTIKAIPAERLKLIANALGTTPEYLMGADDDEPKNEREKQIIAAYNSLSDDNRQLIEDLLDRLLRSQK